MRFYSKVYLVERVLRILKVLSHEKYLIVLKKISWYDTYVTYVSYQWFTFRRTVLSNSLEPVLLKTLYCTQKKILSSDFRLSPISGITEHPVKNQKNLRIYCSVLKWHRKNWMECSKNKVISRLIFS
jgi:hypothetical protein